MSRCSPTYNYCAEPLYCAPQVTVRYCNPYVARIIIPQCPRYPQASACYGNQYYVAGQYYAQGYPGACYSNWCR
jgi:hypothetical protein